MHTTDLTPAYPADNATTTTLTEYPWYTLVPVAPWRRATRRIFRNPRVIAGIIHEALPSPPQDGQRILWRLDPGQHIHHLHVLTPTFPDLTQLEARTGLREAPAQSWVYDLSDLREGQEWRFRLTANPTLSLGPTSTSSRGKRIPVGPRGRLRWLHQKAPQHGFTVTGIAPLQVLDVTDQTFSGRDDGQRVTIRRVQYTGTLRIEDPDLLEHTLTHGIGRGRSYGCGMLTLHAGNQ